MATRTNRRWAGRRGHWEEVLRAWRESGRSVAKFCRRRGLATPTFYQWRKRLGGSARLTTGEAGGRARPKPQGGFLPVRLVPASGAGRTTVEVMLLGGRVLRATGEFSPQMLAELASALEAGRSSAASASADLRC